MHNRSAFSVVKDMSGVRGTDAATMKSAMDYRSRRIHGFFGIASRGSFRSGPHRRRIKPRPSLGWRTLPPLALPRAARRFVLRWVSRYADQCGQRRRLFVERRSYGPTMQYQPNPALERTV
jgi:hypothetical protein